MIINLTRHHLAPRSRFVARYPHQSSLVVVLDLLEPYRPSDTGFVTQNRMVDPTINVFISPSPVLQRADHDYPLSSSPASFNLLTPPPLSPELSIRTITSGVPSSPAGPRTLDFDLAPDFDMSSTSTPPTKRKHQQSTLGSAFAAVSSNANIAPSPQIEKVASDEKRRRISTGWDELCRATVRARQAEERRRASLTGTGISPSASARARVLRFEPDSSAGMDKGGATISVRAEGSSLRTGFSPFKLDMSDVDQEASNGIHPAVDNEDDRGDVDMDVKEDADVRAMSEDEVDMEDEVESSYMPSRRRRPIVGAGFSDTRIDHRKMIGNLRTGKRYQREHCESNAFGQHASDSKLMRTRLFVDSTLPANHAPIPGKPTYLELFNSRSLLDVYRLEPNPYQLVRSTRDWSPAYTCAFSHSARNAWSGSQFSFAAMATECGGVRIIDTNKSDTSVPEGWEAGERVGISSMNSAETKQEEKGPKAGLFAPHANAIYDIKWSQDDTMLATACADQSTGIWDTSRTASTYEESTEKDGLVTRLKGHTASVKTSIWHDKSA